MHDNAILAQNHALHLLRVELGLEVPDLEVDLTEGLILGYEILGHLDLPVLVGYLLFHDSLEPILLVQL
jgi:hypothetical protein